MDKILSLIFYTKPKGLNIFSKKIFLYLLLSSFVFAQEINLVYPKTIKSDFITNIYDDHKRFLNTAFKKEDKNIWLLVGASTALTYYYDQEIYEASRDFGNNLGLNEHSNMKKAFCFFPKACLQVPHDKATSLYYIGDGFTYLVMASSFMAYGGITHNTKAVSVGHQIVEGLLDIAIGTQVLKRLTGRETPIRATTNRGAWDLFPNVATYQQNIPKYDAYPSGHVASTTVAFTILNENYPEHSLLIKTTYTVAMSLLMFEMMHLGVHWASDYPLGIAIGYYFGKVVSDRYIPKKNSFYEQYTKRTSNISIMPIINKNTYGVSFEFIL